MKNSKFEKKHGNINIRPEYFHYEFLENIKVVLASGGKIIFKYVLRLSVPSVLQPGVLVAWLPGQVSWWPGYQARCPGGLVTRLG